MVPDVVFGFAFARRTVRPVKEGIFAIERPVLILTMTRFCAVVCAVLYTLDPADTKAPLRKTSAASWHEGPIGRADLKRSGTIDGGEASVGMGRDTSPPSARPTTGIRWLHDCKNFF
jgi:hypothetical protein